MKSLPRPWYLANLRAWHLADAPRDMASSLGVRPGRKLWRGAALLLLARLAAAAGCPATCTVTIMTAARSHSPLLPGMPEAGAVAWKGWMDRLTRSSCNKTPPATPPASPEFEPSCNLGTGKVQVRLLAA